MQCVVGGAFRPSQTRKNNSLTPRLRRSGSTLIQNFAPSPPVPAHRPRTSLVPVETDPDRRIERPVRDLTVADLDHDRVDEHRRVDLIQRPVRPVGHFLDDLVGAPGTPTCTKGSPAAASAPANASPALPRRRLLPLPVPQEYALANKANHPRNVIIREDTLVKPLDTWLVSELGPTQRRHIITKLLNQARAYHATDGTHRGPMRRQTRRLPGLPRRRPTPSANSPSTKSSPPSKNSAT